MGPRVAIFYIGERRFESVTIKNHQLALEAIQTVTPIKVYHFTQPEFDRSICPYIDTKWYSSGGIQLWDFISAAQRIDEDVIIKLRTDVWFTPSSLKILPAHVQNILSGSVDVDFLGCTPNGGDLKEYMATDLQWDAYTLDRMRDFVIMARKSKIPSLDAIVRRHCSKRPKKVASGNRAFRALLTHANTAISTDCQIYLVRDYFDNPTDQQISTSFIQRYMSKTSPQSLEWYLGDAPR